MSRFVREYLEARDREGGHEGDESKSFVPKYFSKTGPEEIASQIAAVQASTGAAVDAIRQIADRMQEMTIADLPTPGTKRWVIRRKAEVVAAVRGGLLSLEEVCRPYTLTVDEFLSWQYSIDQHGLAGLRSTRTQQYRRK